MWASMQTFSTRSRNMCYDWRFSHSFSINNDLRGYSIFHIVYSIEHRFLVFFFIRRSERLLISRKTKSIMNLLILNDLLNSNKIEIKFFFSDIQRLLLNLRINYFKLVLWQRKGAHYSIPLIIILILCFLTFIA